MDKMWAGRFEKKLDELADDFNSSISFDKKLYAEDIEGSLAHAAMLAACGVISEEECAAITAGLKGILADLESGALAFDMSSEDIHMFIEAELTKRIGDAGKNCIPRAAGTTRSRSICACTCAKRRAGSCGN